MASKGLLSGNTMLLVLSLLRQEDMYGYQIIEELTERTENMYELKTGTLYPLLHSMENDGTVKSYNKMVDKKERKYYSITPSGRKKLSEKEKEWELYQSTINKVLGGYSYAY